MCIRINSLAVLLLCSATALADISDCIDATCRIRRSGATGTGCVISRDDTHFFVLTNAHVAGQRAGDIVQVEFWHRGYQSQPVPGVVARGMLKPDGLLDIAIVAVERRRLGGIEPTVIPLAPADARITESHIVSVGCALGSWPTCWKGHRVASSLLNGELIQFVPVPADGRSGSAIFDSAGKQVVGLIAWRDEAQGVGLAMTHQMVWEFLRGRAAHVDTVTPEGRVVPLRDRTFQFPFGDAPAQDCPQCEGLGLWPFQGKQQLPPTQPPTNPQNPWPDLPSTLGGGNTVPSGDYVSRVEFEATRREFEAALRDVDRRLSTQSSQLEDVDDQVVAQSESLRDKLRQVVTSERVQQEVEALKSEFLKRLKESEESEAGLRERLKESLAGAVRDRIEQIKAELSGQDTTRSGSLWGGLLGIALATVLPMLGLGGLQTWLVTRAVSRIANRVRGEENATLLTELRNLVGQARAG